MASDPRSEAWAEFRAALEAEAADWERAVVEAMRRRHGPAEPLTSGGHAEDDSSPAGD